MSYQSWSDRSTRGIVKHVYILAVCPYDVCDVPPCQLNMALAMRVEQIRKKPSLPCEKRITKTQELWTNKWCHNPLYIEILMIYGIINLYNHMHFFRYLYVFTIHSGVSFPLIVLIHVTWIQYSLQKSLFYLMAIFSSYFEPYMLIIIIVVSTSLNEQWS